MKYKILFSFFFFSILTGLSAMDIEESSDSKDKPMVNLTLARKAYAPYQDTLSNRFKGNKPSPMPRVSDIKKHVGIVNRFIEENEGKSLGTQNGSCVQDFSDKLNTVREALYAEDKRPTREDYYRIFFENFQKEDLFMVIHLEGTNDVLFVFKSLLGIQDDSPFAFFAQQSNSPKKRVRINKLLEGNSLTFENSATGKSSAGEIHHISQRYGDFMVLLPKEFHKGPIHSPLVKKYGSRVRGGAPVSVPFNKIRPTLNRLMHTAVMNAWMEHERTSSIPNGPIQVGDIPDGFLDNFDRASREEEIILPSFVQVTPEKSGTSVLQRISPNSKTKRILSFDGLDQNPLFSTTMTTQHLDPRLNLSGGSFLLDNFITKSSTFVPKKGKVITSKRPYRDLKKRRSRRRSQKRSRGTHN